MDHEACPLESGVTDWSVNVQKVGVGDAVFMPGLFTYHKGEHRNLPIIRHGHIAGMRDERVPAKINGKPVEVDAYLVEIRSIKGLSGSPVFINLGFGRIGATTYGGGMWRDGCLLGSLRGHFHDQIKDGTSDEDSVAIIEDAAEVTGTERMNIGIAMVTPWDRIWEVVQQEKVKKKDAEIIAQIKAASAGDFAEDSVEANPNEFPEMVRRIAAVPKAEVDEMERNRSKRPRRKPGG
jgi:hypothetical protein